jgi:soluble lytic murein transglycosylase-like protein
MSYIPLTSEGKNYINKVVTKNVTSKMLTDSGLNNNVQLYKDNVILWLEKYSKQFNLNSNILAAQIDAESSYRPNVYSIYKSKKTGNKSINAMGITQFLLGTINDTIFNNGFLGKNFNQTEKDLMSNDIILDAKGFVPKTNKNKLLINVSKNPEIMVKAQAVYMNYIGSRIKSNLASVCLYGYNRGPAYVKESYGDTVLSYFQKQADPKIYETNPITEGTRYVSKIFNTLKSKFGFTDINLEIDINTKGFGLS